MSDYTEKMKEIKQQLMVLIVTMVIYGLGRIALIFFEAHR